MNMIIKDTKISISARLLLLYIISNAENGQVHKDKKEIATELGVKRESIIRWVKELTNTGYIVEDREYLNKPSVLRIL